MKENEIPAPLCADEGLSRLPVRRASIRPKKGSAGAEEILRKGSIDPVRRVPLWAWFAKKRGGRAKNRPARLKWILHFTKYRIQRAIRHVEDLVVRWEGFIFHKLRNPVIRLSQAGRFIEGPLFAQDFRTDLGSVF
jgi:hypothetical protein